MFKSTSVTQQLAAYMREELKLGNWSEKLPGRDRLAKELGVDSSTVEKALRQLEKEGLLESQGPGKARRISLKSRAPEKTRVLIIAYEQADIHSSYIFNELRHRLVEAGHRLSFAPKTLTELKHDPRKVLSMAKACVADAYIVHAGSRSVLEAFSQSSLQVFALFGIMTDLPIAGTGPDMLPALREALQYLFAQGHSKIVMLVREERHRTGHGAVQKVFFDELKQHGIRSGPYNLPEWKDNPEGLWECLDSLFKVTPPSALLVVDPILYLAVKHYLVDQRGGTYRKVILICTAYDPSFDWCVPPVPHFRWDHELITKRITRWVNNVAHGKQDIYKKLIKAKFVIDRAH